MPKHVEIFRQIYIKSLFAVLYIFKNTLLEIMSILSFASSCMWIACAMQKLVSYICK